MKDLILITSYCDTPEKQDVLRNLVGQVSQHREKFDIMIVSHTVIPEDISKNVNFALFDKSNDLLFDWDLRCKPWFNPNDQRAILSIFTGFFNTHLAIWRMIILGNSIAKQTGYNKVHHLEYDCDIKDFSEFYKNSELLNSHDCVTYNKTADTVDDILFGTYQAYKLNTLHSDLLVLDQEKIKKTIRESDDKSPEAMLYQLLHHRSNGMTKNKRLLDQNGNVFGMSHNKISNGNTAWCLPYHDNLNQKLGFVIWNMEQENGTINVQVIYNNERVLNFDSVLPNHWRLIDIDEFENAKSLTVILNGKIRNHFDFTKNREEFKKVSFREAHIKQY